MYSPPANEQHSGGEPPPPSSSTKYAIQYYTPTPTRPTRVGSTLRGPCGVSLPQSREYLLGALDNALYEVDAGLPGAAKWGVGRGARFSSSLSVHAIFSTIDRFIWWRMLLSAKNVEREWYILEPNLVRV